MIKDPFAIKPPPLYQDQHRRIRRRTVSPMSCSAAPPRRLDALTEADPTATALGYKMDATKATKRTDKTALCSNCNLYTGQGGRSRRSMQHIWRQAGQRQRLVHGLGQESLRA